MLASQARLYTQVLVDRYVIDLQTAEKAHAESIQTGDDLPIVLGRLVAIDPKDNAAAWCAALGLPFVDLGITVAHPDAVGKIAPDLMRSEQLLGLSIEGNRLTIAVPMPSDGASIHRRVSAVAAATGMEISAQGAEDVELQGAIAEALGDAAVGSALDRTAAAEAGMHRLFERTVELGASDLHLAANLPPFVRVRGELMRMPDETVLSATQVRTLVFSLLTPRQQHRFETEHELDFAYSVPGRVRLRSNLFVQRNAVGAAFRVIPADVVPFEHLSLPPIVRTFSEFPRGMVLVTGPTGSGKSTTLASLVDVVNRERDCHIMTVEDPVEFVHVPKKSLINQREVGDDTDSFSMALRQAMRQDPDVILVGEMRDLETISTAISAAETGHLVFATLHTQDAAQTIDRVVDVFPASQQAQIRTQLATSLQGIVSQQLVPTADGRGRVAACEILIGTTAVRALIREGKIHQIHNQIAQGKRQGMQSIDDALADLVRRGVVTLENALRRARNPDDVTRQLGLPTSTPPGAAPAPPA